MEELLCVSCFAFDFVAKDHERGRKGAKGGGNSAWRLYRLT